MTDRVSRIANLARLGIKAEDMEQYEEDFDRILEYMKKLQEVDVEDVPATTHPIELRNQWREDKAVPGLRTKDAVENAPEVFDGCFRVPPAIEEE